jgi:hypothetical protein
LRILVYLSESRDIVKDGRSEREKTFLFSIIKVAAAAELRVHEEQNTRRSEMDITFEERASQSQ